MAAVDLKGLTNAELVHCEAHAERRKLRINWTRQDLGNYLADRAADRDLEAIAIECPGFVFLEANALSVAQGLAARSEWLITDTRGSPCVLSLKKRLRMAHLKEYVRERNERHYPVDPHTRKPYSGTQLLCCV